MIYSDWSLQMGQMGPKMTLDTLTMSGVTFHALRGSSRAQTALTILLAPSISDTVTQCTTHGRGVANAVTVGQNHFFRKVVINFNFRHGAKKSGHLDHMLQSYGYHSI